MNSRKKPSSKKWPLIFYILPLILLLSGFITYKVDKAIESNELEKRKILIQNQSNVAATRVQKGIEKFSLIIFSIKSFITNNPEKNNALDVQQFLKLQLKDQLSQDSLIVNYLDTNHVFQYSITQYSLTPNSLKGKSVQNIRDRAELRRLESLMEKDNLTLFPPLNLIEGWSGIPLNFRVVRNGVVQGYVAPIMNLQSILDDVYKDAQSKDFVYHFSINDGLAFDRKAVYNGQKIYSSIQDPESFKNFDIPEDDFQYTSFTIHGSKFKVGAAYKKPYQRSFAMLLALIAWMLILALSIIGIIIYWRLQARKHEMLELKNEELNTTTQGLENFIKASSHDLKEPLRNIGSFSTLLKRRYQDKLDDTANQYVDYITSGIEDMSVLLDDLLIYSNLIQKVDTPRQKVNLNYIVGEIVKTHDLNSDIQQVQIESVQLPTIHFNRDHAYRLFENLISNSIKHNKGIDLKINIGYKKEPFFHLFYVKDNGRGIDEAYHDKIFEAFQRLSREKEGTGLGLAICKKIVEQGGGKMWIESAPNQGSVFYFSLPL